LPLNISQLLHSQALNAAEQGDPNGAVCYIVTLPSVLCLEAVSAA
jgi:hypothetical protein